jgi:hypothetical protein
MTITRATASLVAVVAAVLVTVPAAAEDPKPEPTACAGVAASDPKGDNSPAGVAPSTTAADLTGLFFRVIKVGETEMLAVDVQVDNLDPSVPPGGVEQRYTTSFKIGDVTTTTRAIIDQLGDVTYQWTKALGTPVGVGFSQGTVVETTGRMVEGADGVVEVHVPIAEIGAAGKTVTDSYTESRAVIVETLAATPGLLHDRVPDAVFGKPFTVEDCGGAEATATATPDATATATPTATPAGTPPPNNGGGPPQQTPSGTRPAQPNPGQGQPATPAQPAKKPATKAKSCAAKAKKIKNKSKRAKALKRCKKAAKRR